MLRPAADAVATVVASWSARPTASELLRFYCCLSQFVKRPLKPLCVTLFPTREGVENGEWERTMV